MDFIYRLLGRTPSSPCFERGPILVPSRPMTPSMFDAPDPTRPQIEREMRRLLKARDPAQVSIGEQMREDLFGGDAQKALKALKHDIQGPHMGTIAGSLVRLIEAETRRVGSITNSPLFQAHGEASQIALKLLQRLGNEHTRGTLHLRDARLRDLFTRVMDGSEETQNALTMLTLSALTYDHTHDCKVLRWTLRGLGKDRVELSAQRLPRHAAMVIAPSIVLYLQEAAACAERAYARSDVRGAFNHLQPLAALTEIRDPDAKAIIMEAAAEPWQRASTLARQILMDLTFKDEDMRKFRKSHASAGWHSVIPLLGKIDDPLAEALEALAYQVMRDYGNKLYNAPRARKALQAIVDVFMKNGGYDDLEVVWAAKEAIAYRPPPASFLAEMPERHDDPPDFAISSY